jgi:hypothetical protein
MKNSKGSSGGDSGRAERARLGVGQVAIVRHYLGGGLWEFEANGGQTYLAVRKAVWRPAPTSTWSASEDLPPVPRAVKASGDIRPEK